MRRTSVCGRWTGRERIPKSCTEPTLGEEGIYTRERVVMQMEKWLQTVKCIRDIGSQVSHSYRKDDYDK